MEDWHIPHRDLLLSPRLGPVRVALFRLARTACPSRASAYFALVPNTNQLVFGSPRARMDYLRHVGLVRGQLYAACALRRAAAI